MGYRMKCVRRGRKSGGTYVKIGKLTNEDLEKFVIGRLRIDRKEVLLGAGIGIDCAVLDLKGQYCTVSTDPITAASSDAGRLAVHVSANDVAASGAEPFAMLVTMLVPASYTLKELGALMDEIFLEASALHIDIVGGHTEVTDAVTRPVISVAAMGKADKVLRYTDIAAGDSIVLTKTCGIEGALILCADHEEEAAAFLTQEDKALLGQMRGMLSVIKEARIAKDAGAIAMHDITEGGVYGAVYEMAEAAGLGAVVDTAAIPINPVARKACAHLGLDPYRLISSGSLLIAQKGDTRPLLSALREAGISACVVGTFAPSGLVTNRGERILPPAQDELFRLKS